MSAISPIDAGAAQRHLTGWMASLLAHGGAAGIAVLLATEIQLPPPEPFQWKVSLSEPGSGQSAPHTAPAPQAAPTQPVVPSEPAPASVRMTETPAVTQPPMAAAAPTEPVPAAPRPTQVEEPPPVITRATPAPPPALAAQEPVATVSRTAPVESAAAPAPTAQHSAVPPPSGSIEARVRTSEPASAQSAASGTSKRDYGWLAEALWGRIEQLKRYPASARLNRWEGKVILRAVIKEDGHIADLRIAQSSGHDVLDQDALGLMQQASPIPLKQPLGHPQVVVHIPISYKLEQ
ncbi:MAG: TonB family protein [Nitrospiraceae bacterium]